MSRRGVKAASLAAGLALLGAVAAPAQAADQMVDLEAAQEAAVRGDQTVTLTRGTAGRRGSLLFGFPPAGDPIRRKGWIEDVDFGTDAAGVPVVLFTGCETIPGGTRGRCDLFRADPATRVVRKLRRASRRPCDEGTPTMSEGVLVFERQRRRAKRARLRCRGGVFVMRPGRRPRRLMARSVEELDLDGETLAYTTQIVTGNYFYKFTARVFTRTITGGRPAEITSAVGFGDRGGYSGQFLQGLALDDGLVYWGREDRGEDAFEGPGAAFDILRAPAGGGAVSTLEREGRTYTEDKGTVATIDVDDGTIVYAGHHPQLSGYIARVDPAASFR